MYDCVFIALLTHSDIYMGCGHVTSIHEVIHNGLLPKTLFTCGLRRHLSASNMKYYKQFNEEYKYMYIKKIIVHA